MSPADLLAYLIGWHEQVLSWLAFADAGRAPDFPANGYRWNQLGELAQNFYDRHRSLPFGERTQRLIQLQSTVLQEVTARSEADLYGTGWYGKWTKGRMIQRNTASPYDNARARLRRWLKTQS